METLISMIEEAPLAVAFGAAGLFCQLVWPIFRARRAIMSVQFGIGADYSIHYALLDAWSGAGVAALGASQTAFSLIVGDRPWLRWTGVAMVPVVAIVCYATWCGVASLFAFVAVTLVMIARTQSDTLRLRVLMLTAAPFGMGYDIAVGAWPALAGGCVAASVSIAMLIREIRQRRAIASDMATA